MPLLLVLFLVSGFLSAAQAEDVIPEAIGLPTWFGETSPFWYGVISLTLTYGAYMAEVYRAGIEAVPGGQTEAARSLGMSHGQAMRYIIVPQAIRKVIPPLLNDFIALMKDTSLVSVIGALEVVQAGFDIQTAEFNGSGLVLGALFFLAVTIPLARVVDWLISREQAKTERGAARARAGTGRPNPPDRRRPGWQGRRVSAMEASTPRPRTRPRPPPRMGRCSACRTSASGSATSRCCAASASTSTAARSSA